MARAYTPALYLNTGAPRPLGREDWVFRGFRWVRDSRVNEGEVYPATPDEARRFAHKLHQVEAAAYPDIPSHADTAGDEGNEGAGIAGEVEDAGPSGGNATAVSDDAEPALPPSDDDDDGPDVVNIDLYRVGESNWYELPNGDKVQGREKALEALGVEVDSGGDDGS